MNASIITPKSHCKKGILFSIGCHDTKKTCLKFWTMFYTQQSFLDQKMFYAQSQKEKELAHL